MKDVLELMEKQGLKPGQLTIGDCIGLAQAADLKVSDIVVAEAMAVNQMTREEVKAIMRDTTLFGWSNRWLANYARQLREAPSEAVTVRLAEAG